MGKPEKDVSQVLEEFLGYIEECRQRYKEANEAMNLEDRRLQDVLHEMGFSRDENEERRVGRKLIQDQKREEENLKRERVYKPRVKDEQGRMKGEEQGGEKRTE